MAKYVWLAFVLIAFPAAAQNTAVFTSASTSGYSNCCYDGACWLEMGSICHSDPNQRMTLILDSKGQVKSITNSLVTSAAIPTCEDGWTLVLREEGVPACAHELKAPQ